MTQERDLVGEIKSKIDIVDHIGKYVKLRKAGKNYSGLCPFHNEKTPSFIVSPDIQRYKCFGCGRTGDIFNFVQEIETLDFQDALKKLADEVGIKYEYSKQSGLIDRSYKVNEKATQFFQSQLKIDKVANDYAKDRGLLVEGAEEFRIGFAPGYNKLIKELSKEFDRKTLEASGLFSIRDGQLKDRFINRIMFPIWNPNGRIVGFTGRNLPTQDFGPKYLNTPETQLFHKGKTLFGIHQAKAEIKKKDLCIICEGSTDVISVAILGHHNIVAPLGTGLTIEQLELIKKYTERILFIFDNDKAGKAALERSFILSTKLDLRTYAADTGKYKDLDELAQNDPESLKKVLSPKVEAYGYLLAAMLSATDLNSLDGIKKVQKHHQLLTSSITDPTAKTYYDKKFHKLTGLELFDSSSKSTPTPSQKPMDQKRQQPTGGRGNSTTQDSDLHKKIATNKNKNEYFFISLLLNADLLEKLKNVDEKYFKDGQIRELILFCNSRSISSVERLVEQVSEKPDLRALVEYVIFMQDDYPVVGDPRRTLNQVYLRIQIDHYKDMVEHFRTELAISEEIGDNRKADDLTKKISDLTLKISGLNERIGGLRQV